MAQTLEELSSEVKKLKGKLGALRNGGAAEAAGKRKKRPLTEIDVLRAAKKRVRRASSRLQVAKAKQNRLSKKKES